MPVEAVTFQKRREIAEETVSKIYSFKKMAAKILVWKKKQENSLIWKNASRSSKIWKRWEKFYAKKIAEQ